MKLKTITFAATAVALFAFSFTSLAQDKKERPDPEKMLEMMDTDKNETISLDEFKATKRRKEMSTEELEKQFTMMDTDANGELTLEEFKARRKEKKGKKDM
ncbi:EF-hand domain-containing protein [Formosa sediminum]|uniref:EF-hand domain-containing protein n=1 Tax=Formosa sediminum TaxID=2594004 RepID=A0A516GP26_9FLAO|nr:EF-hand domain-containing protein [Formosa sediminum]QDO93282.1 EF-hand domain-containing protein [Formosa sediminum]